MKKSAFIYAFLILVSCICAIDSIAQETSTEENILTTEPAKPDSSRVNVLIKYGEQKEESNKDEAIKIYQQAALSAQRIDYFLGAGRAYHYAGILYSDKGEYEKAIQFYKTALFYYRKSNFKTGLASVYGNIGNVYKFQGENKEALEYYIIAGAMLEAAADSSRMTIIYNNIGGLFTSLKNGTKAIEYSQKALIIAEKLGSDRHIIDACINLSKAYAIAKDTAKSIQALLKGFVIADKLKDFQALNYLHNNLGVIYMYQKKMQQAEHHLNEAIASAYKNDSPYDIANTYFSMAVLYEEQKKWEKSEVFCKKALRIADSLQINDLLAKSYKMLSDIEEQKGNYQKAYEYYIDFTAYNDSVSSREQLEMMHEMEARYQSTAKDKELSQKQLLIERSDAAIHKKNNQILFFMGGTVILVLLLLLIFLYNRSKRKLAVQRIAALEKDRELKVLQAMMDGEEKERTRIAGQLHDGIGGMVSAIKMHLGVSKLEYEPLGKSEAYQQALHLVEDMAKEVRKTAHHLMPEVLHKYGLEEAIRIYCQNTGNKSLDVNFQSYNLHKKMSSNAQLIIYRIVQELVNNAVKHAACTEILVDLSQDEKSLTLTVEDNGKGLAAPLEDSKDGMGLSNIKSKAAALDGKIETTSEPGTGTTINIELPLENLELA